MTVFEVPLSASLQLQCACHPLSVGDYFSFILLLFWLTEQLGRRLRTAQEQGHCLPALTSRGLSRAWVRGHDKFCNYYYCMFAYCNTWGTALILRLGICWDQARRRSHPCDLLHSIPSLLMKTSMGGCMVMTLINTECQIWKHQYGFLSLGAVF